MNFVTGLPISTNWKKDSYDSILVIVDRLTKMIHYKPVKIIIDVPGFSKVIINMVIQNHCFLDSIVTNRSSLFILKFWLSLYYFLGIKQWLSTAFYPQTNSQTKRQNTTIKTHLRAFLNFEQNNWARFLPMAEFAYNNTKNASTGYIPFELNCSYHLCISFKEDTDSRFWSKIVNKLLAELQKLMTVCRKNLYHA